MTHEALMKITKNVIDAYTKGRVVEELEKIKIEITELKEYFYIEDDVLYIIDEHIFKLKGE